MVKIEKRLAEVMGRGGLGLSEVVKQDCHQLYEPNRQTGRTNTCLKQYL